MAITYRTVTGNLADLLRTGFDPSTVRITVRTNLDSGDAPIDLTNGQILLGTGRVTVASDGTFSTTNVIDHASTDVNPTGIQYRWDIDYTPRNGQRVTSWTSGFINVTADADLSTLVATQYVPPSYQNAFIAEAEAIRDDIVDLSAIAVPDALVEALVKNTGGAGPLTSAALTATIEDVGSGLFSTRPDGVARSAFAAVFAALEAGISSIAVGINTDSTANNLTEWFHRFALKFVGLYVAYTIHLRLFNNTTGKYDRPVVLQDGGRVRKATILSGGTNGWGQYAAPAITGDLFLEWRGRLPDYSNGTQTLISQFGGSGNRAFRWQVNGAGELSFDWTTDGTTIQTAAVSSGAALVDNTDACLGLFLDVNNGSGGHTIKHYKSTDNGDTWTQIGSDIVRAGSVTSIFNSTYAYEIGVRTGTSEPVATGGIVYEVAVRAGSNGYSVVPALPEHWQHDETKVSITGAPILTFVGGGIAGANIDYLLDNANGNIIPKKLNPYFGQLAMIFSDSHNETIVTGKAWTDRLTAWVNYVKGLVPAAAVLISTQNPRISPALNIPQHSQRRVEEMGWARGNGYAFVDAYQAFVDAIAAGTPSGDLIRGVEDALPGVHPTWDNHPYTGAELWADTVFEAVRP